MKRVRALCIVFVCLFALCACAESYCDASGRINFYYQYDGGARSVKGTYDKLLSDRIRKLTNGKHSAIVPKDDQYLTGRGCCLFSYAHAYQYLCGYAATQSDKADILYKFLAAKPVWSLTGSSLSPPSACSIYADCMVKQSGVKRYRGSYNTFSDLQSFFYKHNSVLIVNAPKHFVIAVGCTEHNGVKYVQIVDSIMHGTIQSGRCSYGYSMDFSVKYTADNSMSYSPSVHQYWLPYSEFLAKCTVKYAFYTGSLPPEYVLSCDYSRVILGLNETVFLNTQGAEGLVYEVGDPEIASVDADGNVTALAAGETYVRFWSPENPYHVKQVPVYCYEWIYPEETVFPITEGSAEPALPVLNGTLPSDFGLEWSCTEEDGITAEATLTDASGTVYASRDYGLIGPDTLALLRLPSGVKVLEAYAFENSGAHFVYIPSGVDRIDSGAFASCEVRAVFLEDPDFIPAEDAFDTDPVFYVLLDGVFLPR